MVSIKRFIAITLTILSFFYISAAYATQNEKISVLITFKKKVDKQLIKSFGGKPKAILANLPIVKAEVPRDAINGLKHHSNIELIEEDGEWQASEQTIPWGVEHIDAEIVHPLGFVGQGIKVGVLDSGIVPHEDLMISGGWNFIDNTSNYGDDNGHGTHVAGTIVALNNDKGVIGVAPNAPPYSPNLNCIEGLWKWLKNTAIYN